MSQDIDFEQRLESIFERADDLMINKKNYKDAVLLSYSFIIQGKLYEDILGLDPENIDGLNSLATCMKLQMKAGP